jgi:hypothetical protein
MNRLGLFSTFAAALGFLNTFAFAQIPQGEQLDSPARKFAYIEMHKLTEKELQESKAAAALAKAYIAKNIHTFQPKGERVSETKPVKDTGGTLGLGIHRTYFQQSITFTNGVRCFAKVTVTMDYKTGRQKAGDLTSECK